MVDAAALTLDDIGHIEECHTCGAPVLPYADGRLEYITVDEFDGELARLRTAIRVVTAAWMQHRNRAGLDPGWVAMFDAMETLLTEEQRWAAVQG